jgi:hypothetical protein
MVASVACEYTHTIDQIKQKQKKKQTKNLPWPLLPLSCCHHFFLAPYFSLTHTQAFLSFGNGDVMELHDGIEVLLLHERRLVGGEVGRNEWVGLASRKCR